MTQYEREQICQAIGMLYALEFAEDNEGVANAIASVKEILEDIIEGEQELCKEDKQ